MRSVYYLLGALAVVSPGWSADLGGYLERSATSEFSGEQLVACETPDGARDSVFQMAQGEGWVVAWADTDEARRVTMGPGMMATISDDAVLATVVEGTESTTGSPTYGVETTAPTDFLGRSAEDVTIVRDGEKRIVLTIDTETDAVVRTRTYGADGSLYCDRRLLSFEVGNGTAAPAVDAFDVEAVTPMDDSPHELPGATNGFHLLDTYQIEDGTLSYYSDGFFSLGIVMTARPVGFEAAEDVVVVEAGSGAYRRSYTAGSVTVAWATRSGSVAVIGDLPPDLVEAVLSDLPQPVDSGFFERIWSRLFG